MMMQRYGVFAIAMVTIVTERHIKKVKERIITLIIVIFAIK